MIKKKNEDFEINFYNNLNILKKNNPKLAFQIEHTDASALEYCRSSENHLNLKRTYQNQTYFYHSESDPVEEANEWFQQLNLDKITVLYIYGTGLGYYYEAAKNWLDQNKERSLVFLEEDLGVLHRLLEIPLASFILNDSQVQIFHFSDPLEDNEVFNEISWSFIFCPFAISSIKLYAEVNPQGFSDLSHRITHESIQKRILVDEYLQFGVAFFRNFYPNLLELPHSYFGNSLFNKFQDTPAIICGAGPSLDKNSELLKSLTKKALIFAGGSALPALISKGIKPHFGTVIDPNESQLSRVKVVQNLTEEDSIPFFYRNRLFHQALHAIKGPRLYLTGTGGYNIADWFENELGIEPSEPLDEGHNVINFCLEIARELGCNPIVLVGVDLALTKQTHYAEGVVSTLKLTEKDFALSSDLESQPIERKDIDGNPVQTYWKWITESEWISEYAREHSEITIINATEGGLGFKDILNIPLNEVSNKYFNKDKNYYSIIKKLIKQYPLSEIEKDKIIKLMHTLEDSLKRCTNHFDTLINEMTLLEENLKNHNKDILETHLTILTEGEIEQEIGYQYLLETFNLIFLRVHHRDLKKLLESSTTVPSQKKKIQLHKDRLNFLKNVALVNIELMHQSHLHT